MLQDLQFSAADLCLITVTCVSGLALPSNLIPTTHCPVHLIHTTPLSLPNYSEKAGVEITHGILNTRYYDEAVLGRVGESAAEILGMKTLITSPH